MTDFEDFVEQYKNGKIEEGLYTSKNEKGEMLSVGVSKSGGFTISTYQNNGWIRINNYDKDGFLIEEMYEKGDD